MAWGRNLLVKRIHVLCLKIENSLVNYPNLVLLFLGTSCLMISLKTRNAFFPNYDEAFNASVAKNLAQGLGYSTSYNGIYNEFDPVITTGPLLILIVSLGFKIVGVNLWVIPVSIAVLNSLLIFFIFKTLHNLIQSSKLIFPMIRTLVISVLFCMITFPFLSRPVLLGEFTAVLLLILGTLLFFDVAYDRDKKSKWLIAASGLILGMAILTKLITGIFVFFVILYSIYKQKRYGMGYKDVWKLHSRFLASFLIPFILFEGWKLISLGLNQYLKIKWDEILFFIKGGSGISAINDLANPQYVLSIADRIHIFPSYRLDFWLYLISLFILIFNKKSSTITIDKNSLMDSLHILLVGSAAYLAWWYVLSSTAWYRHLIPMLIILTFVIISLMVMIKLSWRLLSILIASILVIGLSPLFDKPSTLNILEPVAADNYLEIRAAEETANFLDQQKSMGKRLLGCGWWANRRLELVMSKSGNFWDCYNVEISSSDLLVIDRDYWENYDPSLNSKQLEIGCTTPLFFARPFAVYGCK